MQLPVPSAWLFRLITLVALICWLAAQILPNLGFVTFTDTIASARLWSYVDTSLPYAAITLWWGVSSLAIGASLVGLILFRDWARWLLPVALIGGMLLQPFMGLAVYSPLESTLGSVYGTAFIWLVTVSFWTPLAGRFEGVRRDEPATL